MAHDNTPVTQLTELVGPTLAALTIGIRDRNKLDDPTDAQVTRARQALKLLDRVSRAESPAVARAWFIGENVTIGLPNQQQHETCPALAIRDGRLKEVEISAQRMIDDSWS